MREMNIKNNVLIIYLGLLSVSLFAQAPGGVSAGLTSWFKIDNAASVVGSPISTWGGSGSTSSFSISQTVASKRPILNSGAINYKSFSYMPYAGFVGASQTFLSNLTLPYDLVGAVGSFIYIGDGTVGTAISYRFGTTIRYQFKPNFRVQTTNNGSTGYTFDFTPSTQYSVSAARELSCIGAGINQKMRYNSALTTTCSICNNATYNPAVSVGYYLGANPPNAEYCSNNIPEVITYSTSISSADMDKIESYLSIKYGITRGGNLGTIGLYNYVSSDGTIIFDKLLNTGYNNNIAGIGRDDASELNKKQSISVNLNEILTIGNGTIASENSTNSALFTVNKEFLVWGNNALPATFTSTNVPEGLVNRLDRVWKAQSTSFVENTTIGFEQSLLPVGTSSTSLALLIDDDGDFSNAKAFPLTSASGPRFEFAGQNFDSFSKMYFTLAVCSTFTPVFSPTVVCQNEPLILNLVSPTFTTTNLAYNWSGPPSFTSSVSSPTISSVSLSGDGTYTLGLSVNGCYYNYTSQPIVVDTAINLTVTGNLVCSGKTATLVANGASNYTWTPTGLNTNSISVAPNTTTVFSLTTTKNSCSTNTVITILVTPTPTLTVNNPVICQGDTATLNVSGAASYVWLPANITGNTYTTSPTSSQIILVTGSNGPCSSASSCTIQVNPLPTDDFIFDLSQAECNAKLTFNLVSGGIPAYTYTLAFGDGSNSVISNSIDHQYQTGVYQTTLTIAQNDCINYVIKPIVINALDSTVIIPNTFSPNNDKINDSYFIKANCITEFELLIFNRWGNLVFKTNDILEKWNGTLEKENVPDGVYSYILNYKKVNQTISTKKTGHITIFR